MKLMINVPANLAGGLTLAAYSRSQEQDADERGLKLAAAAGYDRGAPDQLPVLRQAALTLRGRFP